MTESLIKNAADPKQVDEAEKKEKWSRKQEIEDMQFMLSTMQGRRVLWRFLSHCKVFESIWHPSALIHFHSGRQDVGHFIMSEISEADQEGFLKMMQENYKS